MWQQPNSFFVFSRLFPRYTNRVVTLSHSLYVSPAPGCSRGLITCPRGFWMAASAHTLFFTLYDLDMTRQAQCPLWCLSETRRSSPTRRRDWIRRVSFGPFSFSERGEFVRSKLPVCLESWLCHGSLSGKGRHAPSSGYINCIWWNENDTSARERGIQEARARMYWVT